MNDLFKTSRNQKKMHISQYLDSVGSNISLNDLKDKDEFKSAVKYSVKALNERIRYNAKKGKKVPAKVSYGEVMAKINAGGYTQGSLKFFLDRERSEKKKLNVKLTQDQDIKITTTPEYKTFEKVLRDKYGESYYNRYGEPVMRDLRRNLKLAETHQDRMPEEFRGKSVEEILKTELIGNNLNKLERLNKILETSLTSNEPVNDVYKKMFDEAYVTRQQGNREAMIKNLAKIYGEEDNIRKDTAYLDYRSMLDYYKAMIKGAPGEYEANKEKKDLGDWKKFIMAKNPEEVDLERTLKSIGNAYEDTSPYVDNFMTILSTYRDEIKDNPIQLQLYKDIQEVISYIPKSKLRNILLLDSLKIEMWYDADKHKVRDHSQLDTLRIGLTDVMESELNSWKIGKDKKDRIREILEIKDDKHPVAPKKPVYRSPAEVLKNL